jgi:hypothetical protein
MADCNHCAENARQQPEMIPYIVHEAVVYREMRRARRWMVAFLAAFAAGLIAVTGWIGSAKKMDTPTCMQESVIEEKAQGLP